MENLDSSEPQVGDVRFDDGEIVVWTGSAWEPYEALPEAEPFIYRLGE